MIGGNTGGINKNNLVNSLKTFYNMIKYPDSVIITNFANKIM